MNLQPLRSVLFVAASTLFASCAATVPLAPSRSAEQAKTFETSSQRANIYICRGGSLVGFNGLFQPTLNGRITGQLARNTFQVLSVAPGQYVISAASDIVSAEPLSIFVKAGENYFYECRFEKGWSRAVLKFTDIGEKQGRLKVTQSRMAFSQQQ